MRLSKVSRYDVFLVNYAKCAHSPRRCWMQRQSKSELLHDLQCKRILLSLFNHDMINTRRLVLSIFWATIAPTSHCESNAGSPTMTAWKGFYAAIENLQLVVNFVDIWWWSGGVAVNFLCICAFAWTWPVHSMTILVSSLLLTVPSGYWLRCKVMESFDRRGNFISQSGVWYT